MNWFEALLVCIVGASIIYQLNRDADRISRLEHAVFHQSGAPR